MIVRNINEVKTVSDGNWTSRRMVLAEDNVGFSFHITTINANTESSFQYKNHIESVYCISGTGSIEDLSTGEVHEIVPGVIYVLDKHDRHTLRAGAEELVLACVFNPPITGDEVHDEDGSYSLPKA